MSEIIITFSEPWYNEPIITNTAFDEAVNNYVKELVRMIKVTDNKEIKETVLSGLQRKIWKKILSLFFRKNRRYSMYVQRGWIKEFVIVN